MRFYDASVVITSYNQNLTLPTLLAAIQNQDFAGSYEVIVTDDGSEQDTLSIIKLAQAKGGPPIRYVWQGREGAQRARTRNNGIAAASGRVIVLLDGDMVVFRDFIHRHVVTHTGGRTATAGGRYWLYLDDMPDPEVDLTTLQSEVGHQRYFANTDSAWTAVFSCNFSFARNGQPLDEVLLMDERFIGWGMEDQEFACRLQHRHGYRIQVLPSIYGFHLEPGMQQNSKHLRVQTREEIAQYLHNLLYFCSLYPDVDILPGCISLANFELDAATDTWRSTSQIIRKKSHIRALLNQAREWIERHPVLPSPTR